METLDFFYQYFGHNPGIERGQAINISGDGKLQHQDLDVIRSEVFRIVNDFPEKENGDVLVIRYGTSDDLVFNEFFRYQNSDWLELTDLSILDKSKYELLAESEVLSLSQLEPVETWDDIAKNFLSYQEIDKKEPSKVLQYYSSFFHWYYWPEQQLFAPSKFLGYKNSSIQNYDSAGSGGVTNNALKKFFIKLDKNSEEFQRLYNELNQISKNNFGKVLNDKVLNGTGGIYVPKK